MDNKLTFKTKLVKAVKLLSEVNNETFNDIVKVMKDKSPAILVENMSSDLQFSNYKLTYLNDDELQEKLLFVINKYAPYDTVNLINKDNLQFYADYISNICKKELPTGTKITVMVNDENINYHVEVPDYIENVQIFYVYDIIHINEYDIKDFAEYCAGKCISVYVNDKKTYENDEKTTSLIDNAYKNGFIDGYSDAIKGIKLNADALLTAINL